MPHSGDPAFSYQFSQFRIPLANHAPSVTRIAERACRALKGERGLHECNYVYLPGIEGGKEIASAIGLDYFSVPVEFSVSEANIHSKDSVLVDEY